MKEFNGIKHSKKTNIYYKFVNGVLYKKAMYRNSNVWEISDYKDINEMSKYWVDVKEIK